MRVKTLFLDAGGVLMNPNWARVAEALARRSVPCDAATLAAAEPRAKHALDVPDRIHATDDASRGRIFFDLVLEGAGVRGPQEAIAAAWGDITDYHQRSNLWEVVPADVFPTLDRLRAAGLTLAVVSNANGTLRASMERLGLAARVDVILDSFEEGVEKPDPRLFELALERSGGRKETTVHVGDLYHVDVVGARAAGIEAVLLDAAGLYAAADCARVASLTALADEVEAGRL